jgi:hypothetical protein
MRAVHRPSFEHRAALALLLAGALLICHGLLGASHVLAHEGGSRLEEAPAAGEEHRAAHSPTSGHAASGPTATEPAPGGEGAPVPHVGAADYFAVLLALLGAAALGLLRVVVRAPFGRGTSQLFWPYPRFAPRQLPRGPSPPLLQVFRL